MNENHRQLITREFPYSHDYTVQHFMGFPVAFTQPHALEANAPPPALIVSFFLTLCEYSLMLSLPHSTFQNIQDGGNKQFIAIVLFSQSA